MIDNSKYQSQVVAGLQAIARALIGSGGASHVSAGSSSSQSASSAGPVAARLDSLISVIARLVAILESSLFITVINEDEEEVQIGLAQIVSDIKDSLNPGTEDSLAEVIAKALDPSEEGSIAESAAAIASNTEDIKDEISTGDQNIVDALTGQSGISSLLSDIQQAIPVVTDYSTDLDTIKDTLDQIEVNTSQT